jgi:hypothetical protein
MPGEILFDGYKLSVTTLTENGVVTPMHYEIQETPNGIVATARDCVLYGDPRRPYAGEMTLRVEKTDSNGLTWQADASMAHLIKGVKVKVDPIPGTALIEPGGYRFDIEDGNGGTIVFPGGWYMARRIPQSGIYRAGNNGVQLLFIQGDQTLLALSSEDYPPRFQRTWAFRKGDQLELTVYLEANISERKKQLITPNWKLEPIQDYEKGIQKYQQWAHQEYGLEPLSQRKDAPDWVQDICFNITFHCQAAHGRVNVTFADIERILEKTATYFDPANTQLHVVGWDGPWDMTWPAYQPGEELGGADGFHRMIDSVHRLGYKIGLHMNVMGFSFQNPQFEVLKHFLQYQCRDSANRRLYWEDDMDGDDQDELFFAYISPDAPEWRNYLIDQILKFVETYKTDIVHLDQSTSLFNDHNFNHWRGVCTLYQELRKKLPPEVALSGEYVNELVAHLYPLCGYYPTEHPAMQNSLYSQYVRSFNYGMPPEQPRESLLYDAIGRKRWSAEAFYENLAQAEKAGLVPTLLIGKPDTNLESEQASAVFAAAERFRERMRSNQA